MRGVAGAASPGLRRWGQRRPAPKPDSPSSPGLGATTSAKGDPVFAELDTLFPFRPGLARARGILVLSAFLLVTLIGIPFQAAALALRMPRARRRIPHVYHRLVCRLFGIRVTVLGTPAAKGHILFVSNHCSWLDIPVLSAVAPLSFVAKQEVADWPFFGLLAKLQRSLFITRERRGEVGRHRDAIRARLEAGDNLVLFPEGTSSDGNRVLPFKTALFAAAEASEGQGAPPVVQPVSVAYVGRCGVPMERAERPFVAWYGDMDLAPHLWDMVRRGPVEAVVILHPPLRPEATRSRKDMAAAAQTLVAEGVARALAGEAATIEDVWRTMAVGPSNTAEDLANPPETGEKTA